MPPIDMPTNSRTTELMQEKVPVAAACKAETGMAEEARKSRAKGVEAGEAQRSGIATEPKANEAREAKGAAANKASKADEDIALK